METLRTAARKPKKGTQMEIELDFAFDRIMRTWYGMEEGRRPTAPLGKPKRAKK